MAARGARVGGIAMPMLTGLAVLAALLVGVSALSVVAASGDPSYEFAGEYVDAEHTVVDFGQRWYDSGHQVFYATDPAPAGDPGALVGVPQLAASYALNHANSYRFGDPDGLMPKRRKGGSSSSSSSSSSSGSRSRPGVALRNWRRWVGRAIDAAADLLAPAPSTARRMGDNLDLDLYFLSTRQWRFRPAFDVDSTPAPVPEVETIELPDPVLYRTLGRVVYEIGVEPEEPVVYNPQANLAVFLMNWVNQQARPTLHRAGYRLGVDPTSFQGALTIFRQAGLATEADLDEYLGALDADEAATRLDWRPPTSHDPGYDGDSDTSAE